MAIFTVKICISHCATSAYADIYGNTFFIVETVIIKIPPLFS